MPSSRRSLIVGSPAGGPTVENAYAAVKQAAGVTADAAKASGTVVVRIMHDGELWTGETIRWHGDDASIVDDTGMRSGGELLLVDGRLYAHEDGWVDLGEYDPENWNESPTDTHLAPVREDVSGATLRRITGGMKGLTTSQAADGSTVYSGSVAAGLIAREPGFKEGEHLRLFPFGYVAHDEAADPDAPLDVALTVDANGLIERIAVARGVADASAWTYTVTYKDLAATAPIVAPNDTQPLRPTLRPRPPRLVSSRRGRAGKTPQ